MPTQRIVVIGASSGGIEALRQLVAELPADFPAPICVVLHTSPDSPGLLHVILKQSGRLDAVAAQNDMKLRPGVIYVPPPDHHLLVEPGAVRVTRGPKENRFRPAIDPLFRSAAQVYGPATIAVVLTGNLDDGTAGLSTVKRMGGVAIVQDPSDALFPSMPLSALTHVDVDLCLPLTKLADALTRMANTSIAEARLPIPNSLDVEVQIAKEGDPMDADLHQIGAPSPFACPECHGVLLQLKERTPLRFRCHTGHAFTAESLLAEINDAIEDALWIALRTLEEGRMLLQHVAEHEGHRPAAVDGSVADQLAQIRAQTDILRKLVTERARLSSAT